MLIATHAIHADVKFAFTPATWQLISDSSFSLTNINAINYSVSENQYIAVGNSGKIGISLDLVNWSSVPSSGFLSSNIYSVWYGNNRYVIGGSSGKLATSEDGTTWTQRSSSFGASTILAVTYAPSASLWVAAGGSGKLATSVDGINWTQRTSSFGTSIINAVTATSGGGKFIAVGESGKIANSTNGTTWTQIFPASSFGASSIRSVSVSSDGAYLAGGATGKLGTSFDGIGWIQRVSQLGTSNINGVFIDNDTGLAVGNSGKISYSV